MDSDFYKNFFDRIYRIYRISLFISLVEMKKNQWAERFTRLWRAKYYFIDF